MEKKFWRRIWVAVLALVLIAPALNNGAVAKEQTSPKHEMRAAWIATVQNIDMRSGMNEGAFTKWAEETLDFLKEKNFNTVIYQVKPTSDTLYPSEIDPWSKYITGQPQGTDPGYDPLAIMIEEAHSRGIEVHAWVNPYRVTMPNETLESLSEENVARENPEWVVRYGQQYYLNPGIPEVKEYLISVVDELVTNYDIEAIHMDDYFYPYRIPGAEFPDQTEFELYGGQFDSIEDWRRDNVNQLVAELNESIKDIKEYVQFGISPFGVWRNIANDPTGSNTTAGQTNYDDLYADTRQWIKDGSIDYITPQIYWSRGFAAADYSILLDWWSNEVKQYAENTPVNLYIGTADYKVGDNFDQNWYNPYELPEQILDNRQNDSVQGQMHFSLQQLLKNRLGYADILENEIYTTKALVPATPWNDDKKPKKPKTVHAKKSGSSIELKIDSKKADDHRRYVIYRFDGNKKGNYHNPENILDVVYAENGITEYVDHTAEKGKSYVYGVTSVSNTGVESKDAKTVKVKH